MEPLVEPIILVTRGDELPKNNYGKKLHPTFETSIRIKNSTSNRKTTPHVAVKFFLDYRNLCQGLAKYGVGEGLPIHIEPKFPPNHTLSSFGVHLSEEQLQQRCFMLNKWMSAVFEVYADMPPEAQELLSNFLSLHNDDPDEEANKDMILAMLRKKKEAYLRRISNVDEPEIGPESEKKKSFFKSFTSKKLEKDEMDSSQNSKKQSSTEAISIEKVQKKKVISESPNSSLNGNVTRADKANSSASDSTPISDVAVGSKPEETGRKKKTNVRFNSIEGFGLDEKTKREIILDEQEDLTAMTNKTNVDRIEGGIVVPSDVNVTWSAENLQIAAEDEHTGFSRETIAGGGFLAVSVMRGEMVQKDPTKAKTHVSYETIIRMLPFREIQVIDSLKNEMNVAAYEDQLARTPPINIARPFDGYRDLKQNLEKCGVVCRKNITTDTSANQNSTDYDRRTEASYSVMSANVSEYFGDQKDLIIINADFPRTYKRSAFGIKLSDEQITKRVIQLNRWVGELFKNFAILPPEAQDRIITFLDLDINNSEQPQNKRVLAMLLNLYQPEKKQVPTEDENNSKKKNKAKNNSQLDPGMQESCIACNIM